MADVLTDIDRRLAQLRAMPGLARELAPEIASIVERELAANIARGVGPDGTPWQLTQDGNTPLRNAARALSVRAVGTTIVVTLAGVESRHHVGHVRGGVRRPILPGAGELPAPIARAIDAAISRAFARAMGAT